ncbi:hypothetical protein LVJ83_11985 [Uruburuella testudinis]|uniref:Uncharacterized protein n=1 Tax=Uruburuella testudinis TaxID=1282863 RepID=A0ABY4DRG7_9NEIS|nr:hypothetical protein [Uruburuella testudinis]UOO81625.1 hypothetical protein LVJ83_11985 [Uruburuella testudinis]
MLTTKHPQVCGCFALGGWVAFVNEHKLNGYTAGVGRILIADKWFDVFVIANDFGRLKHIGFEHLTHIAHRVNDAHKNPAHAKAV